MLSASAFQEGGARGPNPQEAPPAGPNTPAPLLEIGPFKGLDLWRSPLQMQDQYLTDMSMMVLDEVLGAITISPGRQSLFTTFTAPPLGMDVLRPSPPSSNTVPMMFSIDGSGKISQIDYVNNTTPIAVTMPAGLSPATWSSTAQTFMATLNHRMLFTNGINSPIKMIDNWNTAAPAAQLAGIVGPTTAPKAASTGASGNLLGSYRWRCTFGTNGLGAVESSAGPASDQPGPLAFTSVGSASLTNLPVSTDPQVTNLNIYRLGGSIPEWRLVASITNGVTTYVDNVVDTSLGGLMTLDRGVPPSGLTQIIPHKGRIFGFIGPSILFTLYNEPEAWPLSFQLPVGDNSPIVAIGNAAGSPLFIWKKDETWVLLGESVADFQLVRLFGIGCMGPRAWCAASDTVTWLANDGFSAARYTSTGVQKWLVGTPIWSVIKNLPVGAKSTAVLASDGSRIMISLPSATPAVVYSLNTRTGDWEREKNPLWLIYGLPKFGEWEKFPFQAYDLVPLFSGSDPGYFAFNEPQSGGVNFDVRAWPSQAANPYLDLGAAVTWFMERKQVDKGSGMSVKRYSEVEIVAPVQTTGKTLTLTFTVDDDVVNKQYSFSFALDQGPARLGLPPNVEGTYCTIRLSGAHSQKISIDRIRVWGWIEHRYKTTAQFGST